jgi:hypothetical protein
MLFGSVSHCSLFCVPCLFFAVQIRAEHLALQKKLEMIESKILHVSTVAISINICISNRHLHCCILGDDCYHHQEMALPKGTF